MAAGDGITASQLIGWGVTALAFAGTMFWNLRNRQHTNQVAAAIRLEKFEQDVWERHRARIDTRLEELTSFVSSLPGQLLALPSSSDPQGLLEVWGYNLALLQDALARALAEADASAYCAGGDWEATAAGNLHGSERSWDVVVALFEQARVASSRDDRLDILKKMNPYVLEVERLVRAKMRDADFRYQP